MIIKSNNRVITGHTDLIKFHKIIFYTNNKIQKIHRPSVTKNKSWVKTNSPESAKILTRKIRHQKSKIIDWYSRKATNYLSE